MTTHLPYAPDAVLFDLDGTLFDTALDFLGILNHMLEKRGRSHINYEQLRTQVSNGAGAMVCTAFDITLDDPDYPTLRQELLDHYFDNSTQHCQLFEGLEALLVFLEAHSIPWGIVTNKPAVFTQQILDGLNYASRCAVAISPDHVTHKKPHAEPLLKACSHINASPEKTVYVGDHIRDIESGKNAGCTTIAVEYGYISPDSPVNTWDADYVASRPTDILPLLESIYTFK